MILLYPKYDCRSRTDLEKTAPSCPIYGKIPCCKWDFRSVFNVEKKSHNALLLVVFQKCVQYFEKKSRCFAISGISEVCSFFNKSHDALL